MDLWIVVGAAAAGYITKYWQNISRDRDSLSQLPSKGSSFEKPESPSCLIRRLARRKKPEKDVSADRRKVMDQRYADMREQGSGSSVELFSASEFDGEKLGSIGNYEDCNLLSISSLPSVFLPSEHIKGSECESGLSGDIGDHYHNPSRNEMGSFHGSTKNKRCLRTKNSYQHFIKPLNSLESCLMAQLYQKHTKMEEYVLSSLPSPSTQTVRPLFVTDGSQIISRASAEFHNTRTRMDDNKLHKEASLEKYDLLGVPPLPHIGSLNFPKRMKFKSGKAQLRRLRASSKFSDRSHLHSHDALLDGKVLFCLGISVGIISSFIANRREVDKLKDLLKQTENLVQDLQEELEMKDSLTMKELANENNESLAAYDNSIPNSMTKPFLMERNRDNFSKHDQECYDKEAEESSESMSKIEAELEAELERMGLNMNSSRLERRLSDFVELDPDFEADFAQGELRADMINRQAVDLRESNQDGSGTSTHHSGNYAVSPRELSLRLHEVIQSRLEERVKELETALEYSQRKVQLLESERKSSWRKFSNTELRYSSDEESKEQYNSMAEPLVMNLSGEALDAYNEAYEELMKINDESEEEDSPSGVYQHNHQVGSHPFDRSISWAQNDGINQSSPHVANNTEKTANEFYTSQRKASEDHSLRVQELLDVGLSTDDNSDGDDEMEKQLIRQIVEKTKKGSPVVLNAQKRLFLMDEDEH